MKLRLVLINNYNRTEKTEATVRSLARASGEKVQLVDYRTPELYEKIIEQEPDLIFLSGSSHMLTKPENQRNFEPEMQLIRNSNFPILGICYGHQMIGLTFGSRIVDLGRTCTGYEKVRLLHDHPVLQGLSKEVKVAESHRQALASVPRDFECLGESASTKVEIIAHKSRPIYGFQFHPERSDETHPDGKQLIQNVLKFAKT